jgi:hypothetical protein
MTFENDGAERVETALSGAELSCFEELANHYNGEGPGVRITDDSRLSALLRKGSAMDALSKTKLGQNARPVRAVLFDKSATVNWALGWHQDRTIAVRKQIDCPGFGPWSKKAGIVHVEPPFGYIERMVTIRAHLDACDGENAPLLIALGSHRFGRVPVEKVGEAVQRCEQLACLAGTGDVWIYATPILHASDAAKHPRHRRVLQVDYSCDPLPGGLEWLGI